MKHNRRFGVITLFVAALCISLAVIIGAQFQKPALPAVGTIPLVTARPAPAQRPSLSMHEVDQWTSGAGAYTIKSMASSPAGNHVAAGNSDGNVEIWEVAGGRLLRTMAAHLGPVMAIAFSPTASTWPRPASTIAWSSGKRGTGTWFGRPKPSRWA